MNNKLTLDKEIDSLKRNKKSLLKDIGDILVSEAKSNIDNKSFNGRRWKKGKYNYGHPLLKDTLNLYNSFKAEIRGDTVILINTAEYSSYQNAERRFMGVSNEADKDIKKAIDRYLDKSMK